MAMPTLEPAPVAQSHYGFSPQGSSRQGFVVGFNPVPTANLLATRKRIVVMRVISLVVTALIDVAFWWFTRGNPGPWRWWVIAVSMATAVGYLVFAVVQVRRAGRALKGIGAGEAFVIHRDGIAWDPRGPQAAGPPASQIVFVGTGGRAPVPGTNFVVKTAGGATYRVPLLYLDALPGTIDGALRAYTGTAVKLDVTSLDAMLSPGAARPVAL